MIIRAIAFRGAQKMELQKAAFQIYMLHCNMDHGQPMDIVPPAKKFRGGRPSKSGLVTGPAIGVPVVDPASTIPDVLLARPDPVSPEQPFPAQPSAVALPSAPHEPAPERDTEAAASPALDSDALPADPQTVGQHTEELADMATLNPDALNPAANADKVQAVFGDMSTRFKAALEKSQKLGEELVELTKGNVEALVASARVAAKGGETIGQDVGEYGRKSLEGAISAMKGFASVKSPTELFQLQSDYLKNSFDSAVAEASKLSESMLKIAGEAAQPLSSRYAVAAEKIKSATL